MDAIFSLPYSEHQTIENICWCLPKSEGYGVFVAVSRQQACVDFAILRGNRMLRAQVKSSRHFEWTTSPTLRFWYKNFITTYRPGITDVFFLFGLYPVFAQGRKVSDRVAHWRNLILVFSDAEMGRILKRTGKDRFFQFGIDPVSPRSIPRVIGTRGGVRDRDLTPYMLYNREEWLRQQFRRQS